MSKLSGTKGVYITYAGITKEAAQSIAIGKEIRTIILTVNNILGALKKGVTFNESLDERIRLAADKGIIYRE